MFFALIIAWIVFIILLRIVKTTVINALMLAGIVFLLQVGYGITLRDILNFLVQLPQQFSQSGR
jgi:FtsH-binding integral membrane protein